MSLPTSTHRALRPEQPAPTPVQEPTPGHKRERSAWLPSSLIAITLFGAALLLNWLTPMMADDFHYFLKGDSWPAIWTQYTGWSGRLVADTLSSFVLDLGSHSITVFINSLALVALCWIVTSLGARLAGRKHTNPWVFLLVALLYWVANPILGQTTFWLVGAANYLWTNVFNFGFLLAFAICLKRERTPLWLGLALCVLGLLAGCSNENTGLTSWLLLAFLGLTSQSQSRWPLLWLGCMGIGILVLLGAPGNFMRADLWPQWYDQSFLTRLWEHLTQRLPGAMFRYWQTFLVLGLLAWRGKGLIPTRSSQWVWLLIGASVFANVLLVIAPHIPSRALQGGFLYTLVALALLAHHVLGETSLVRDRWVRGALLVCCIQWLLSFGFMLHAYYGITLQNQVRTELIKEGIRNNAPQIEIPAFFFPFTLRPGDQLNPWFMARSVAHYYDAHAKIIEYPVAGAYSLTHPPIATGPAKPLWHHPHHKRHPWTFL